MTNTDDGNGFENPVDDYGLLPPDESLKNNERR